MKQKVSRGFCGKVQITFRLKETAERLTGGLHPSGLNFQTREKQSETAPRGAVVAGGDPWRGKVIGVYLCVQGAIPRLWEVVVVAGEYHVGGDACSGGRRFGWSWISPERAARSKLRWGLSY